MEFFEVLRARRSCRKFKDTPIPGEVLTRVLEGANLAPSPMNRQPWEFVMVRNREFKERIFESCQRAKTMAFERSGWKWLGPYKVDFLLEAPVLVGIVGDPSRTGADRFFEGRSEGYQYACAAAVQNLLLAATDAGLGSLWFSLFDRKDLEAILGIDEGKELLSLVCLGYCDDQTPRTTRKDVNEKVTNIES